MNRRDKNIMNGPETGGPDGEKMTGWKAESEKKFEVMSPPEVTENHTEQKLKEQNDRSHIHEISNEKRQLIYKRSSWYDKPTPEPDPEKDIPISDRQQFLTYDEQNRVTEELGQTLSTNEGDPKHENQWRTTTEYTKDGQTPTGKIETGPDSGHTWQEIEKEIKRFDDGRRIVEVMNTITAQGQNMKKPEKGDQFKKVQYWMGNKWLCEQVYHLGGSKKGQVTEQFADGVEKKIPDWK